MPEETILVLRHGETDYKRLDRYQGSSPAPRLTERGRRQTDEFLRYMQGIPIDRVVCSPVRRAVETLEQLAPALRAGTRILIDDGMSEARVPEWEGRFKDEILLSDGEQLERWRTAPHHFVSSSGTRPLDELYARVEPLLGRIRESKGVTLVVGHDHANRALIASALEIPRRCHALLPQEISSLSILHATRGGRRFELRASNLPHQGGSTTPLRPSHIPRLLLVRHGVTSGNRLRIYQGAAHDPPLEAEGRRQIGRLGDILGDTEPEIVWSSRLRRALESAELLPFAASVPRTSDERLNEYDYGHWSGRAQQEVEREFPTEMRQFRRAREVTPIHGAEPLPDLHARISDFLADAWRVVGPRTGVIVAHDVVIRVAITVSLGLPFHEFWQFPIENGAVTELVRWRPEQVRLQRHNVLPGRLEDRHDDEYF